MNGTLLGSGTITFTNGMVNLTNLNWSEVGNIDLIASNSAYLVTGFSSTGNTGTGGTACNGAGRVGNFIPDHFDTTVTDGCGGCGFTYSGQQFTVQVTARNGLPSLDPTVNYDGSAFTSPNFAKAVTLSAWDAAGTVANPGPGAIGNVNVAASAFAKGVASVATPITTTYTFATAPTVPTVVRVRAVDTDSVTSSSVEGQTSVRSGRMKIANAYGSELRPLNMSAGVQYYQSAAVGWVSSSTDNSTSFNTALSPAGNIVATIVRGPLAAVTIVGPSTATVTNGVRTITLAAPGQGNTGAADLSLSAAPSYLLGGSNVAGVNPSVTGRATFGIYKNSNNFIYRQEQ